MSVTIQLPEDLAAEIDTVSSDRSAFVSEAVRQALRDGPTRHLAEEIARINSVHEELNREACEVLEYQAGR